LIKFKDYLAQELPDHLHARLESELEGFVPVDRRAGMLARMQEIVRTSAENIFRAYSLQNATPTLDIVEDQDTIREIPWMASFEPNHVASPGPFFFEQMGSWNDSVPDDAMHPIRPDSSMVSRLGSAMHMSANDFENSFPDFLTNLQTDEVWTAPFHIADYNHQQSKTRSISGAV